MSSTREILKSAEKQLQRAQAALDAAKDVVRRREPEVQEWRAVVEALSKVVESGPAGPKPKALPPTPVPLSKLTRIAAAERLLWEAGGPMNYRDIGKLLRAAGFGAGARNEERFLSSLYTNLQRRENRFVRVKPGVFDLKSRV